MVLNNYIELLTSPATFFRKMDRVKNYFDPWFFFIIFGLLEAIVHLPVVIVSYAHSSGGEDALIDLIATVAAFALLPLKPFLAAGIAHIGMLILGHDGYYKTFKPMTYAMTINAPYSLVGALLTALAMAVSGPAFISAKESITSFVLLIPLVLIGITATIHTVYATCVGAAHTHKISKVRAFCGMYLIPAALFFALALVVGIVFLLFFVGMMATAQ